MRDNIPELCFPTRADFRAWLSEHADISDGIYLIFSKKKSVVTVKAAEALEAFCALPPSTQLAEARWYQNYKSEERRESVFCEIVEKLERGDTKIKM